MKLGAILREIGFTKKSDFGFPYTKGRDNKYSTNYYFNTGENMYRVMATVVKAIKDTMADEINQTELPVAKIVIEPTKREIDAPGSAIPVYDKEDTRRADLYMKYIQKQMPAGAEVRSTADKGRIEILLPTE